MRATIFIRNNATEEVAIFNDIIDEDIFIWTDGNYSCDCNRFLFFERAKGNEVDWEDSKHRCSDGKYSVNIKVGDEYYLKEFDD